ncbi:MAG TPA: hypothetical protein VF915_19605 [Reyranella sp.]
MLSKAKALSLVEDQKLIDEASCEEIVREYPNYSAAEREVEAEIQKSNAGATAANVASIAEGARKKGCRL